MLNPFLNNYILSLSSRRQERVSAILNNATLAKDQLDLLAQQLTSAINFVPLVLRRVDDHTIITASDVELNFRDIFNRLVDLYRLSNQVTLLLDSHQKLLGSDIKALNDQLVGLDKTVKNYSFLLTDGGSYNFGYIELFNDQRGRDQFDWPVPDRGQQKFSDTEQAAVRIGEGSLVLPDDLNIRYSLTAQVLKGNATAFTTSDTGIANAVSTTSSTGWRMAVAASNPVTATLPEAPGSFGAQVLLEFDLNKPSPCSEIQVTPLADAPMQIWQLTTFTSDADTLGTKQLVSPMTVDKPVSIHFPLQPVSRFQMILVQPTYVRGNTYNNIVEEKYRRLSTAAKEKLANHTARYTYVAEIAGMPFYSTVVGIAAASSTNLQFTRDLKSFQTTLGPYNMWNNTTEFERTILNFFTQNTGFYNRLFTTAIGTPTLTPTTPGPADPPPTNTLPVVNQPGVDPGFSYQYTLGIRYIGIGSDVPAFKGVFVSRPIPSDGDMGMVRVKVDDLNYRLPVTNRDSSVLTSIEYSVSNQSTPQNESDWLAILPAGVSLVEGERLFPNISGKAIFRFLADRNDAINVYSNGYNLDYDLLYDPSGNFISGVSLDLGSYTSDDVLTARYFPSGDQTIVDFTNSGFDAAPLTSSHDSSGAGERFLSTSGRDSVDLTFFPYIDLTQIDSSLYQPIAVIFQDGTTAINLTNYRSGAQPALPVGGGYYFLHSGNVLLFNSPITQPFRVYYQYLQNNVRIRVVLRANSTTFVSPKVHCVHLKAKTRRSGVATLSSG